MAAKSPQPRFSEVLCIGLGLSGICLGAQLRRKLGFTSMHFYERNESHSGTWWSNHYPGAACDIPAVFYSFSFEHNPNWSRLMPTYAEIREYVQRVVDKYQLRPCMTFRTECESARWDDDRHIWSVYLRDLSTGEQFAHECRVLYSAVGVLVDPKEPNIPGKETFEGPIFHTARWRDDVDIKDRDVIVVGNGCSATQMVPVITPATKTLTQFVKSPHWLLERYNTTFGPGARWAFRNIPLLERFVRVYAFLWVETGWRLFYTGELGERLRRAAEKDATEWILSKAPEKYHRILIPDWEIACKRRIFDDDAAYLTALHSPNLYLTKDPIVEIIPRGVRTATQTYPADVIIMATGFETDQGLGKLRVQGRDGIWLDEHWKTLGGARAYNSTAVHGFPNFWMLYGPNSTTGHTSVILAIENIVNYSLRVLDPVLKGEVLEVEVKAEAENEYTRRVHEASQGRVWRGSCNSWYVANNWDSVMYPWSQFYFWWRSVNIIWNDWEYKKKTETAPTRPSGVGQALLTSLITVGLVITVVSFSGIISQSGWQRWSIFNSVPFT